MIMKSTCDVKSRAEYKQCFSVPQQSTYKHTSPFYTSCVSWCASNRKQKKTKKQICSTAVKSAFHDNAPVSRTENILKSLPSLACTWRLLLGLHWCLWRIQLWVSKGSFLNSDGNCAGGVQVHDKPADDSELGNRYEELLPRGAACSLVCCQRLPWMDHKVCPHSRTYGDNVKKKKKKKTHAKKQEHNNSQTKIQHTATETRSGTYAHEAISHSSNSPYAFCICQHKLPAGQRVSRCIIQMSHTSNLSDVMTIPGQKALVISFVTTKKNENKQTNIKKKRPVLHYTRLTVYWRAAQKPCAGHRKDMMVQQMPNWLLIWQPWACCRSSSSCLWLANWDVSGFCGGRLSKSNLSTWMAILQRDREEGNQAFCMWNFKSDSIKVADIMTDGWIFCFQYNKKGGTCLKNAW